MGMGVVVEKDRLLSEQTRVFHPDDLIRVPQRYAVAVSIHCCPEAQQLRELRKQFSICKFT
jgi:hypothetical protein